ncbi:hypothetical protein GCM10027427_09490 [Pseudoclavibacter terrae]
MLGGHRGDRAPLVRADRAEAEVLTRGGLGDDRLGVRDHDPASDRYVTDGHGAAHRRRGIRALSAGIVAPARGKQRRRRDSAADSRASPYDPAS